MGVRSDKLRETAEKLRKIVATGIKFVYKITCYVAAKLCDTLEAGLRCNASNNMNKGWAALQRSQLFFAYRTNNEKNAFLYNLPRL